MSGHYILIRAIGASDEESGAIQYQTAERVRMGGGSFSMTSFELEEDESPVVLAKRLMRGEVSPLAEYTSVNRG